jgi:hypothetical protein
MIKTPQQIFNEKKISGYINPTFAWSDFIFPEDGIPPLEHLKNIKLIADTLRIYQYKVFGGRKVRITSGYRSRAHHIRVYAELGITDPEKIPWGSLHLKGLAVDFTVDGLTNKQVYELMDKIHFGGVEFPDNQNRIHIDIRPAICRFVGSTGRIVAHHYNAIFHDKVFHS